MATSLPGWPVEPWQIHPHLRRLGYSLRESVDEVFLIYGGEEIVATFQARAATVHLLDLEIERDIAERLRAAAHLNRSVAEGPA